MPLELRKRHKPTCLEALKAKQPALSQAEILGWRDCRCTWYLTGNDPSGRWYPRRSLKTYSYERARNEMRRIEDHAVEPPNTLTLEQALAKYITNRRIKGILPVTLRIYEFAIQQMIDCMTGLGITRVSEVTPDAIQTYQEQRVAKGFAINTLRTNWLSVRCFFAYLVKVKLLKDNPTTMMELPERPVPSQDGEHQATLPLDPKGGEANYRKYLAHIPVYCTRSDPRAQHVGVWTKQAEHLIAFSELLYETGLRCSDACLFNVDAVVMPEGAVRGRYTTVQHKLRRRKITVTVFPPRWLVEKIKALPKLSDNYVFYDPAVPLVKWECRIRNAMRAVSNEIGLHIHPHRFRDTFSINMLNKGMSIDDVSKLLGHRSVSTTEWYYTPPVDSAMDALEFRLDKLDTPATPPPAAPAKLFILKRKGA